jgi:hypothetical protein
LRCIGQHRTFGTLSRIASCPRTMRSSCFGNSRRSRSPTETKESHVAGPSSKKSSGHVSCPGRRPINRIIT